MNTVLDEHRPLSFVHAGDLVQSHLAATSGDRRAAVVPEGPYVVPVCGDA